MKADPPMKVVPLVKEHSGPRLGYYITMGVRGADQEWKRQLNRLIAENQPAINELLASFGVPLLDDKDQPIGAGGAPATLNGARVLTTGEAAALSKAGGAVFIDVMPQPPRPNLPAGTIWRDKPRHNIPGSLWLPDTGYGALAAATDDYFRNGLATASGGDQTKLLVVYCQRDCWMSWNAA